MPHRQDGPLQQAVLVLAVTGEHRDADAQSGIDRAAARQFDGIGHGDREDRSEKTVQIHSIEAEVMPASEENQTKSKTCGL